MPDGKKLETDQEKIKWLAGAWDSACAFEAQAEWHQKLREIYRMTKGYFTLLKSVWWTVTARAWPSTSRTRPTCASWCALIADEKIQTQASVMNVNEDFIENIDCPGSKERGQSEICAVSGQSAGMQYAWTIFVDPRSMELSGKPDFVKA